MSQGTPYRYARATLVKDYLLAGAGLVIATLPFVLATPGRVAALILAAIGVLALGLAVRTGLRQSARFVLAPETLTRGHKTLEFAKITGLRLRHFAPRRDDHRSGWMEMRLSAPGCRMSFDSGLEGFQEIARAAHGAALANGIRFDPVTAANLTALGLPVPAAED